MTVLLIIIYLAFISLGLPDSLLGSAWPVMRYDFSADLGSAGIIYMVIAGGTIVSSLFSGKLIVRFGTGRVTFFSTLLTAGALFGFSAAPDFYLLCLLAVPLGLGGGCIDAALNNFVALNYQAKHMSWLHCFWGIGATAGPLIMSFFLAAGNWRASYISVAAIQLILALLLFLTLPIWAKAAGSGNEKKPGEPEPEETVFLSNREALRLPDMKLALISFVCYCAVEAMTGLWSGSFLTEIKGLSPEIAARWTSYFYAGITAGRFLSGFAAIKMNDKALIRLGQIICLCGIAGLVLPLPNTAAMLGLILIGLGCAPIYPCMLHETPERFGKNVSQSVMGLQMAFAYVGSTFFPPLLGFASTLADISILPIFLAVLALTMFICSEIFTRRRGLKRSSNIHL